MVWHKAVRVDELPVGAATRFQAGSYPYLVARVEEDGWRASDVSCTHAWGPLDEGVLQGHVVTCPLHGARFDLRDGAPLSGPAQRRLRTFPVRIEGDDVLVDVPEDDVPPVRPGARPGQRENVRARHLTPPGSDVVQRPADPARGVAGAKLRADEGSYEEGPRER